MAYSIAKL